MTHAVGNRIPQPVVPFLITTNMLFSELLSLGFESKELELFSNPRMSSLLAHRFRIPKRRGGYREIVVPTTRHKLVLSALADIFKKSYVAPKHVIGYIDGVSVVDGVRTHVGKRYVFCTDLKDFFGSLTCDKVYNSLIDIYSTEDAEFASRICCIDCSLPIGSPCSPILSNISCRGLDAYLSRIADKYRVDMTRYADDITFSSNDNVFDDEFVSELRDYLKCKLGFELNEKKTRLYDDSCSKRVTGIVVNEFANVPRSFVREIDNLLYIWDCYGYAAACRSYELHHPGWKGDLALVLAGKIGWFRHVRPESVMCRRFERRLAMLKEERTKDTTAASEECREWARYKYVPKPIAHHVLDEEEKCSDVDMSGDDDLPF